MRPDAINWFARFYLASVSGSVLAIMLNYSTLRDQAIARGGSPAGTLLGVVFAIVSGWLFWYFIVRRASNIAKWILVVLTVMSIMVLPSTWNQVAAIGTSYRILNMAAYFLGLVSIVFLFQTDAVIWFRSKGKVSPVDPEVFS